MSACTAAATRAMSSTEVLHMRPSTNSLTMWPAPPHVNARYTRGARTALFSSAARCRVTKRCVAASLMATGAGAREGDAHAADIGRGFLLGARAAHCVMMVA